MKNRRNLRFTTLAAQKMLLLSLLCLATTGAFVIPPSITSTRPHPTTFLKAGEVFMFSDGMGSLPWFDSMRTLMSTTIAPGTAGPLADYAPQATSLFNNMKLPAAVVTAGMISLGFATQFPELPPTKDYAPYLRDRCETLKRIHIGVALISVTSELIAVLWAAVEVNQLTERVFAPTTSVWDLIQRDCDLAWSAVNSHFVLGIIGFVAMLSLRAYVLLIASEASKELMYAASTGTGAALCLMISIVNRGVQAGGGTGIGYGGTILDLLQHYGVLLYQQSTSLDPDGAGPGPLQFAAIVLEAASIYFVARVLVMDGGDKQPQRVEIEQEDMVKLQQQQQQQQQQQSMTVEKKKKKARKATINGDISLLSMNQTHHDRHSEPSTSNPTLTNGIIITAASSSLSDVDASSGISPAGGSADGGDGGASAAGGGGDGSS